MNNSRIKPNHSSRFTQLIVFILAFARLQVAFTLIEEERLQEYHLRNYTWPAKYNPPTEGWKLLMDRRFAQISQIPDTGDRYEAYVQTVSAAITAPQFTEKGWGLARAPQDLVDDLKQAIREGLENPKVENKILPIEGPLQPWFIRRTDLTRRVLYELQSMHEEWSGIRLKPVISYGFRLYRNESRLNMHVDKPETHVISSILHIDHSEDSEPWPIVIEDFQGNTNEVVLESGDMLFYESSKCFHGRPKTFNGSWYTSVFTHYKPRDKSWRETNRKLEAHYAVPPIWHFDPSRKYAEFRKHEMIYGEVQSKLKMVGTSMKEPDCEDTWCALSNSVKYFGPVRANDHLTAGSEEIVEDNNEEL